MRVCGGGEESGWWRTGGVLVRSGRGLGVLLGGGGVAGRSRGEWLKLLLRGNPAGCLLLGMW